LLTTLTTIEAPVLTIKSTENTVTYGRFVVEPLPKGWGVTLGNAMRRVLLSSLQGAAVTWLKIEGVQHEFTSIPHMKEDAIDFMLNVKQIRLKALGGRPGKLNLDVEREGTVTAGDIAPAADFQIVNPDLHLATLDSTKAKLHVEFNIETGSGYQLAASASGLPVGAIPVDAVFSPVRRINFAVEFTRPGEESTQERLVLEVTTDGTITPDEAVSQTATILIEKLSIFKQLVKSPDEKEGTPTFIRQMVPPDKYGTSLEQLNLSTRTYNSLRRAGISTLGELLEKSMNGLPMLPGFGTKSQEEVKKILEDMGLANLIQGGKQDEPAEDSTEAPNPETENEVTDETPGSR